MNVQLLFFNQTDSFQSKSLESMINLSYILVNVLCYSPLIVFLLGLIGFVGNTITYLQPELRNNTCCLYTYFGSIVDIIYLCLYAIPDFLGARFKLQLSWTTSVHACRILHFLFTFLPNLSINFLVMSMIDRYACTCSLTSKINRLNQLKVLRWTNGLTILVSSLSSLYVFPMVYLSWKRSCAYFHPEVYTIVNLIVNGFIPPMIMLIFVLLTYYNIHSSRQRVSNVGSSTPVRFRNQFIALIIAQVIATAFISIQWMIISIFYLISNVQEQSVERRVIFYFTLVLSSYFYYLNNVKSFYVSLATSRLFREKFLKGLMKMFPRYWSICGYEFVNCQRR